MKFFRKDKDGGNESHVTGYWLFESKSFGSIVLLKFDYGTREVYHTHAFNAVSWVLWGGLTEYMKDGKINKLSPSFKPVFTGRNTFHKVAGNSSTTWAISFRGGWVNRWKEYRKNKEIILTHGRKIIE